MMASRELAASFVRDTLGCGCSAELLSRIEIAEQPRALGGVPVRLALNVGGRLLVCVADEQADLEARLAQILEDGTKARDAAGFHRFRFVVAAAPSGDLRERLMRSFDRVAGRDDRVHVHVVAPSDLEWAR
jgi:hypothetical protein